MPKHIEIELAEDGSVYKLFMDHQFVDYFLDPTTAMDEAIRLIRYNLERSEGA